MSVATTKSHKSRNIGYARVSTPSQTTDQQILALRRAGCHKIFVDDGISATADSRPGLEAARGYLLSGDVFSVWAIDRAFRSTMEAITFLDELNDRGIGFLSLTQSIDTLTPEGRKWYIDTASWAEYERAVISRRTKEKMAFAKEQGRHLGRPFKLNQRRVEMAFNLINNEGKGLNDVAKEYRVAPITIMRAFKRYGLTA